MKGRKPTSKEEAHIKLVVGLGCIVCLLDGIHTPCEVHHTDGKTKPGAHFWILGLCYYHHRGGADCQEYTSRHPHKAAFEDRYDTEENLMDWTLRLLGLKEDD
ncbi:MAG: Ref family protein [Gammaproteobacteria bacterium]|nr:Ref family protein [Gammaproteobacteria bacterium]